MLQMSIGDNIKNRRLELGLSVDELASRIGKNRSTVYRYESKEIENLTIDTLEPLAHALQTTPGALMGIEGKNSDKEVREMWAKANDDQKKRMLDIMRFVLNND